MCPLALTDSRRPLWNALAIIGFQETEHEHHTLRFLLDGRRGIDVHFRPGGVCRLRQYGIRPEDRGFWRGFWAEAANDPEKRYNDRVSGGRDIAFRIGSEDVDWLRGKVVEWHGASGDPSMELTHRQEYAEALEQISARINCSGSRGRRIRYLKRLFAGIAANPHIFDHAEFHRKHVRGIHDRVGWMAKDTPKRLGACTGAIYRTEGFMRIPVGQRVGSKRGPLPKNIHIEHTVPAHHLALAFARHVESLNAGDEVAAATACDLLAWFMNHSVCTAMTGEEENLVQENCDAKRSPCFDDRGEPTDEPYPFRRYLSINPALRIFNVVTGEWIALATWSLEDHRTTLKKVGVYYLGATQDAHCEDT